MTALDLPRFRRRAVDTWERLENPVLSRELRARMRGSRSYLVTGGYTLFVMSFVLLAYWLAAAAGGPVNRKAAEAGRAIWMWGCVAQSVLLPLVVPALTCGAITVERERDLLELLLLTRQSPLQICAGKLFSGVSLGLTLVLASTPVLGLAVFLGGVSPGEMAASLCVLVSTVLVTGALGLVASALMARTVTATVLTYLLIGVILVAAPLLLWGLNWAHNLSDGNVGDWGLILVLLLYLAAAFPPALAGAVVLGLRRRERTGRFPDRAWWMGVTGLCWSAILLTLHLPGVTELLLQGQALVAFHPVVAVLGLMDRNFAAQDSFLSILWCPLSVVYAVAAGYCFTVAVVRVRRMRVA